METPFWIKEAVKNAADYDTARDLEAILEAADILNTTDSLRERAAAEHRLRHSTGLLYRLYTRPEKRQAN